jgi:hypothetical protein
VVVTEIATSRGCGFNAQYFNEVVPIGVRVDVSINGVPQATAIISVTLDGGLIVSEQEVDAATNLSAQLPPALVNNGTHQLTLFAHAKDSTLVFNDSCTFQFTAAQCMTACDCPTEQRCTNGQCVFQGNALYCCESPMCPMGSACQHNTGGFSVCGMP